MLLNVAQQLLRFVLIVINVDLKLFQQSDVATQPHTENNTNHSEKQQTEEMRVFGILRLQLFELCDGCGQTRQLIIVQVQPEQKKQHQT